MKRYFLQGVLYVSMALYGFAALASGGGSGAGNGESVVVLPDKTIVPADPYFDGRAPSVELPDYERRDLPADIVPILRNISMLLPSYGATFKISPYGIESDFIDDYVLNAAVEYRFTNSLPGNCDPMPLAGLPEKSEVHLIACTQGSITWIVTDLFNRLTDWDQVKVIIHERLHAWPIKDDHTQIVRMIEGLDVIYRFFVKQARGERPVLNEETDVRPILELVSAIRALRLDIKQESTDKRPSRMVLDDYAVTLKGGGLVHKNNRTIHSSAYVGVGAVASERTLLASNAVLLTSNACYFAICRLGKEALVDGLNVAPLASVGTVEGVYVTLGAKSAVTQSFLSFSEGFGSYVVGLQMGIGARLDRSAIRGGEIFTLDNRSKIEDSYLASQDSPLRVDLGKDAQISRVSVRIKGAGRIVLDNRASLIGLSEARIELDHAKGWYSLAAFMTFGLSELFMSLKNGEFHGLRIKRDRLIDFEGKTHCHSGKNTFRMRGRGREYAFLLHSVGSLTQWCTE